MLPPVLVPPTLSVRIDGAAIGAALLASLERVVVQQRLSAPTLCELTFVLADECDASRLQPGGPLRVSIGHDDQTLFTGRLTAVEHAYGAARRREIRVRGYDALHVLRQRQPVRAHVDVRVDDLARELTADLGLGVDAMVSGPTWRRLFQYRQSDLDFLVDIARRCGLSLTLRESTLHLMTLEGIGPLVGLELGDTLLEASVEANGNVPCRSVSATGWDPSRVTTFAGRADRARMGREVDAAVDPERVRGTGVRALVDEPAEGTDHVVAAAQAELDTQRAREVTLTGVALGSPQLRPGARVDVGGLDAAFNGTYVLTRVTHTMDRERGYVTEIDTAPPSSSSPSPRATFATFGIVTRIDDPEQLGRVLAKLPSYGDLETEWMGVLSPGAGAGKGFMTLPDVGDQVLIVFPHGDPAVGFVIGGLWGATAPPDVGIEGGAVARYTLLTPGRQRIQLDDTKQMMRLENSAGSFVELSPAVVRLHAATDLVIEAPGRHVLVQADAIDFKRG